MNTAPTLRVLRADDHRADLRGRVRCIMLSMHLNTEYVLRAFAAGALGRGT